MKTVCKVDQCNACMACAEICGKGAIEIRDSVRACNAVIDQRSCVNCGACYRVCPVNDAPVQTAPVVWKEGWAADEGIRADSSSGGLAAALELAFIRRGGIVCSCVFEKGRFDFAFAKNEEQVKNFKGSKYVKSNPSGIYRGIQRYLKEGEKILFVGLPCQVAAVRNYVGDHANLCTVDLICHGTPSPSLLQMFLGEHGVSLEELQDISFRRKIKMRFEADRRFFSAPIVMDDYMSAFLGGEIYTENCYECRYASLQRVADLTLGDSWGSNLSDEEKQKGISLILVQTEKGKALLEQAELSLFNVDLERAIQFNHQLSHPSVKTEKRGRFFKGLEKGFGKAMKKCHPKIHYKNILKTALYNLKILRGGVK